MWDVVFLWVFVAINFGVYPPQIIAHDIFKDPTSCKAVNDGWQAWAGQVRLQGGQVYVSTCDNVIKITRPEWR